MAYIPRSSLIPKNASNAIPMQVRRRRTVHVFGLIGTLFLVGSLLSSVGIFLYKDFLEKQLDVAKQALGAESSENNERKIEEIRVYDNKLRVANRLLDDHIAPSLIFEELENSTKGTVQFTALDFSYDPGFEAEISIEGNTEEFTSVALQKMQLFEDSLFSEFVVQEITSSNETVESGETENTNPRGKVKFNVTGLFKKGLIEYTAETNSKNSAPPATATKVPVIAPATNVTPSAQATTSSEVTQQQI